MFHAVKVGIPELSNVFQGLLFSLMLTFSAYVMSVWLMQFRRLFLSRAFPSTTSPSMARPGHHWDEGRRTCYGPELNGATES